MGELWSGETTTVRPLSSLLTWTGIDQWSLVAAAAGRLFLVHPDGRAPAPFGSYSTDPGPESYIAMAPGLDVPGAGCRFEAGEIYVLEPGTPQADGDHRQS